MKSGRINYSDGKYYIGETRNEIPLKHGKGKVFKPDGNIYLNAIFDLDKALVGADGFNFEGKDFLYKLSLIGLD